MTCRRALLSRAVLRNSQSRWAPAFAGAAVRLVALEAQKSSAVRTFARVLAASGPVGTVNERGGKTLRILSELYPTREVLDEAGTGAQETMSGTFGQLGELLGELSAR